jgi:phosphoglycerate kinase
MEDEVKSIDRVLNGNASPVTAIIGGSKVSSKIAILENLMNAVDNIIIGGGMAFTFIKAQQGKVGSSLVEDDKLVLALELMEMARNKNVNLYLPTDAIIADAFAADANHKECSIANIPSGWMGLDIGVKSREHFSTIIAQSKTVLWNGPMGVFEMEAFAAGTIAVANALVEATKNGSFTLVGGGDSVAAINQFGLANDVSYVSTGGGAMLESLEGIELPGVAAITK